MSKRPATTALRAALDDWRRHTAAFVLAGVAVVVAVVVGGDVAYYGAALAVFAVWMAWFVLTAVEWLRRADF